MITSFLSSDGKPNTYWAEPTCCFISHENHDRNTTEYSHIPSLAFQTLARSTVDIIGDKTYEETKRTYKVLLKRVRTRFLDSSQMAIPFMLFLSHFLFTAVHVLQNITLINVCCYIYLQNL